jgi:hypothetical protein
MSPSACHNSYTSVDAWEGNSGAEMTGVGFTAFRGFRRQTCPGIPHGFGVLARPETPHSSGVLCVDSGQKSAALNKKKIGWYALACAYHPSTGNHVPRFSRGLPHRWPAMTDATPAPKMAPLNAKHFSGFGAGNVQKFPKALSAGESRNSPPAAKAHSASTLAVIPLLARAKPQRQGCKVLEGQALNRQEKRVTGNCQNLSPSSYHHISKLVGTTSH